MIVHKSQRHFNARNIIQHQVFINLQPSHLFLHYFLPLFFSASSFHGALLFFSVSSETLIKKWGLCLFTSVQNNSFDGKMYLVSLLSQHPPSNFFFPFFEDLLKNHFEYIEDVWNKKLAIGRGKLDLSWLKNSLKETRNEVSLLAFVADWNSEFWDVGIIRRWILKLFPYRFLLFDWKGMNLI